MKNDKIILIGGALGLLILAVLGYSFVLAPRFAETSEINAQTETVTAQNDTLRLEEERLTTDLNNAETNIAEARKIQVKFPGTAELPLLFDAIEAEAKKAGIPSDNVTTVTPSNPELVSGAPGAAGAAAAAAGAAGATGGYATMTVNITANGEYGELIAFLSNLQNLNRVYLVDTSAITDNEDDGYALSVTGRMILVDQAQMDTYIAEVEKLAGLPASTPIGITVEDVPEPVSTATATPAPVASGEAVPSGEAAPAGEATPAPAASGEPAPAPSATPAG